MAIELTFKGGSECGRKLSFPDDRPVLIGSAADATVRITDDVLLAPRHCVIEPRAAGHLLRALDRDRRTIVNNKPVATVGLMSGDILRVGLTVMEFRVAGAGDDSPPQASPANDSARTGAAATVVSTGPAAEGASAEAKTLQGPDSSGEDIPVQLAEAGARRGYELRSAIGRGGFGTVYKARRLADQTDVAIKALHRDAALSGERLALFRREIRIHRRLDHPHIVRLLDDEGLSDDPAWFAMEFVDGTNLRRLIHDQRAPMAVADACAVTMQILSAVDYAHTFPPPDGPFVHRDISPGNIMIAGGPGHYTAKLADFGLAKNFENAGLSGMTRTGDRRGTLECMSPQQLRDSKYAGPAADLHALGTVLYFCLAGRMMYPAGEPLRPSELIRLILERRIVPIQQARADVPGPIAQVIERTVGLDEVRPFHSARQMLLALEQGSRG